ncbi:hypothetical protein [Bdellovibrio sp. KM01]|uniref:hypothetical protein n=1 Tax=Bdellovibrio sp. KM01 TaxID=2748865 RepID=UPI0015EA83E9|nr:hypothetical protein [Bdellovibrio sp. KM01]QLY27036.1 hypothetical protein HW988_08595 [Bdellovibrio sp. KM01]
MIKLISTNTGPSIATFAKILLINSLNDAGMPARLYGNERWPENRCAFQPLSEFSTESKDIILNDGFTINSFFHLVNLDFYRYSAGRKRRVLQIVKCIFKYVRACAGMKAPRKCILFKHAQEQTPKSYYNFDARKAAFSLEVCLNNHPSLVDTESSRTILMNDISANNKTAVRIINAPTETVILAGAIVEPSYFRENIIPLLDNQKKSINYIGLQDSSIDRLEADLGIVCEQPINELIQILR